MTELFVMASLFPGSSVDGEDGNDLQFDTTRDRTWPRRGRGRGSRGGARRSRGTRISGRGRSASRGGPFGSHLQTGTEDSRPHRERCAQSEGFHSGLVGPTLVTTERHEPFTQRGGSAQRRGRHGRARGGRGRGTEHHLGNFDINSDREATNGYHSRVGKHRGRPHAGHRHNRRNLAGTKYLSRDEINALSSKDSSDVIRYITENEGGFLAAYSYQRNCGHPLTLKHLLHFLYLLVKSDDKALAARLVAQIFDDSSTAVFCTSLDKLIKMMPAETTAHCVSENPQYLTYLIELGKFAIAAVPASVMYTFPYLSIKETITKLSQKSGENSLVQRAQELADEFSEAQSQTLPQPSLDDSIRSGGVDISAQPPQHFTELPVLPSSDEVHPYAVKPYLRPNIIAGAYTGWEHYLDVQFRLLREDFVAPLREGIKTLELQGAAERYLSEIRVYEGVRVCKPECLTFGVGFTIRFDTKRFQRVNWEHSKRLIFGSLLCLSCDNFQTIYFATVVKRDPKLVKKGQIMVQFEDDEVDKVFQIDPHQIFLMVESTAYFEAFRHNLKGLKRASAHHFTERLQIFKRYLVDCKLEPPILEPRYLRILPNKRFQLKEVLGIKTGGSDVVITDDKSWPSCEHTGLDASQLCAFRAALTQEVSVIQGPPGTGKTYIGLKVIEALVANKERLRSSNFPILVLCYTNHALDQFLEGILSIKTQSTKELNIIRIGGRCKSIVLQDFVLKAKVDKLRSHRSLPYNLAKEPSELRREMEIYQTMIERALKVVKVTKFRDRVFKLHVLTNFIQDHHLNQLTRERPTQKGREIDVWLKLWHVFEEDKETHLKEDQVQELSPAAYEKNVHNLSESDGEFIQVDREAHLLKNERTLEREELEMPKHQQHPEVQDDLYTQVKESHPQDDQLQATAYKENDHSSSDSDDEFIQVDAEAHLLEDERMLEGEEVELPKLQPQPQVQDDLCTSNISDNSQKGNGEWNVVQISSDERRWLIKRGHFNKPMSESEANAVTDIWKLSLKRRWSLYLYWVNELVKAKKQLIADRVLAYNEICKEYIQSRQEIDAHVIQSADIVGMTTTGAAKYNHILSRMYPKIVIIEEAAELLEAHVFTSLTPSVQQLIMIGDHKQLRPKANCYELEKNYGFCVSLFERLARNGFPVITLEVQHRMRPEIASLICPTIYDKLLNNENVEQYEHVKGVGSDVFFIDHTYPEKANDDKDRSHSNQHEADYLVALCKYFLKQGYRPTEITVLTMYRGQLLELKKRMHRDVYDGVRVAAVDDFQGEENEIILLSLVRSNSDGKIGFLNIENRICVSLSRAKIGLFVIGNLSMLRNKHNTVWPQILANLSQRDYVGKELSLCCQVHPENVVLASTAKDFLRCPEGGCEQKCDFRFSCGHSCPRLCHPVDMEHKKTKCQQKCPKFLECGHRCNYKCYQCKEGCRPCSVPMIRRIDLCKHEVKMPCHQNPLEFACTEPCGKVMDCGHLCQELCSRICTRRCRVHVDETLPCGHVRSIPCYLIASKFIIECKQPCDAILDCGHKCSGECGLCQRGRLHKRCQSQCGRTLVCDHVCNFPCTPNCPPCTEKCNNYCVHSRCQRRCYEACVPCAEPCRWKCRHFKCTRLCSEMCDRPPCNEPCKKKLRKCGHRCIGLCGEKCPTKCRICDREEVCEIFFGNEEDKNARFIQLEECGHVIEVTACDAWMEQEDDDKPAEVQFKSCPKCKTQIRKSLRYGNIVKQTLQDYENIKRQQLSYLNHDLIQKLKTVRRQLVEASSPLFSVLKEKFQVILLSCAPGKKEHVAPLPLHLMNTINAQLIYSTHIVKIVKSLSSVESYTSVFLAELDISIKDIEENIWILIRFLTQDFLSDQMLSDIESEVYRLTSLIKLLDLWCKIKYHGKYSSLSIEEKLELRSMIEKVQNSGWKSPKMKENDQDEICDFVTKWSEKCNVKGLTDSERIEIVKAIGLTKGHWFKCPNGHYYCIGECGGAMEEAKCPECGATIGGQKHTLRDDNQLAPEMDGAQHAAWSELANLDNFDPDQFEFM